MGRCIVWFGASLYYFWSMSAGVVLFFFALFFSVFILYIFFEFFSLSFFLDFVSSFSFLYSVIFIAEFRCFLSFSWCFTWYRWFWKNLMMVCLGRFSCVERVWMVFWSGYRFISWIKFWRIFRVFKEIFVRDRGFLV